MSPLVDTTGLRECDCPWATEDVHETGCEPFTMYEDPSRDAWAAEEDDDCVYAWWLVVNEKNESVWEVGRPSKDDITIGCDCESTDREHLKDCMVWQHDAWACGRAEWEPVEMTWIYIHDHITARLTFDKDEGMTVEVEKIVAPDCSCKPQKVSYCGECRVQRDKGLWVRIKRTADCDLFGHPNWKTSKDPYGTGWNDPTTYMKCRHYGQKVTFPDGTVIHGSSMIDRKDDDPDIPDIGAYFASSWQPAGLAYWVPWADYGLPQVSDKTLGIIINDLLKRAKAGERVEIGCMGGHGRTGTMMAIMATLCGVPVDDAQKWVHDNYCKEAIEGEKQVWFIKAFYAGMTGTPVPEMPKVAAAATGGGWATMEAKKIIKTATTEFYNQANPTESGVECDECGVPLNSVARLGYLCSTNTCSNFHKRMNDIDNREILESIAYKYGDHCLPGLAKLMQALDQIDSEKANAVIEASKKGVKKPAKAKTATSKQKSLPGVGKG